MEANKLDCRELMIGNHIKINNPKHRPIDNGKLAKILEIRQDSVSLQLIDDEYGINSFLQLLVFITGVPLTEEILIKCGATSIGWKDYKSYNINAIQLNLIDGNWIEYVSRTNINYLHELQNFHYWHKKQNLEIKL